MSTSRSSTCIDSFPNPLSAMPEALYIPGAPSLGRPLKDNLSDPRCSAQHRPLPHRAPPGRSPSTVARSTHRTSRRASPSRGRAGCAASSRAISTRSRTTIRRRAVRSRHSAVSSRTWVWSSRRRLVLDGSSAVPLPGDVADVDGDVQHIDADDHRTGSTLKTTSVARAASRRSSTRVGMVRPARHGAVPGEGAAAAGRPGRRRPPVPCRCHGCAGRRQVDRATPRSRGAGGRHRR